MQEPVAIVVARIVLFTILVTAIVLAFDVVALLLLNLVTDRGVWVTLLFAESLVMMLSATIHESKSTEGKGIFRTYRIRITTRYPDVQISIGVAGAVLLISAAYLVSQHY